MQDEPPETDGRIKDQNCGAEIEEQARHAHNQWNHEKSNGESAGDYWHPLGPEKETVACMIGEAEDEVSDEPAQCEQRTRQA